MLTLVLQSSGVSFWKSPNPTKHTKHKPAKLIGVWATITGWWFQIFFIFIPVWGNDPIWLSNIFQMGWNHQLDNICVWGVFFFNCTFTLTVANKQRKKTFIGNWPSLISGHFFTILKKVTFAELPGMDQWIMPYLPQSVYTVAFCLVEL